MNFPLFAFLHSILFFLFFLLLFSNWPTTWCSPFADSTVTSRVASETGEYRREEMNSRSSVTFAWLVCHRTITNCSTDLWDYSRYKTRSKDACCNELRDRWMCVRVPRRRTRVNLRATWRCSFNNPLSIVYGTSAAAVVARKSRKRKQEISRGAEWNNLTIDRNRRVACSSRFLNGWKTCGTYGLICTVKLIIGGNIDVFVQTKL